MIVYPVGGGSPTLICGTCAEPPSFERGWHLYVNWSPDGKFLYLNFHGSVYAIPLRRARRCRPYPPQGFERTQEVAALPGARLIREQDAFPGPNPSVYAFTVFHSPQYLSSSRALTEHGAPGQSI